MSGVLSQITFGTYTFPASFLIESYNHDSTIEKVSPLGLDGAHITPGLSDEAVTKISAQMGVGEYSATTGLPLLSQNDFAGEAAAIYGVLASGYQLLTAGIQYGSGLETVQAYAQKRKYGVTFDEGYGRKTGKIAIELTSQDPRWLSTTVHSGGVGSITNAGNANTYPQIQIAGASTNPTVTLTCPGGYISLSLALTLSSGQTLTINTDPRLRANGLLLSGVPVLYALGTSGITNTSGNAAQFPYLAPGTWTLSATGGGTVSVLWQDAWWMA